MRVERLAMSGAEKLALFLRREGLLVRAAILVKRDRFDGRGVLFLSADNQCLPPSL